MAGDELYKGPPKAELYVSKVVTEVDPIEYMVAGAYPELSVNKHALEYAVILAIEAMNPAVEEA